MMSALDTVLNSDWRYVGSMEEARAELAALRDENLQLSAGDYLLREIGAALNCTPDATILQRIAEQARQIEKMSGAVEALDDIITCAQCAGGKYTISGELFDEIVLTREQVTAPASQAQPVRRE